MLNGRWDLPEVAEAQRDHILGELQDADNVKPFVAFDWAMKETNIIRAGRLLDIGCGVGHYGVLCERRYPGIQYTGTDASAAMIEQARQLAPLSDFEVCDFFQNDFELYNIVLVSQVIEFVPDRWAALEYVLKNAWDFVILNRIRLTTEPSHEIDETTYAGHVGKEWLWNYNELITEIQKYGVIVGKYEWDNQCTLLVECNE